MEVFMGLPGSDSVSVNKCVVSAESFGYIGLLGGADRPDEVDASSSELSSDVASIILLFEEGLNTKLESSENNELLGSKLDGSGEGNFLFLL